MLKAVKDGTPETGVIVMTAYADIESAIGCVRGRAFDLILKPFELTSLLLAIARAVEQRDLRAATSPYQANSVILASEEPSCLPELVDLNDAIRSTMRISGAELRQRAQVVADLGAEVQVHRPPGRAVPAEDRQQSSAREAHRGFGLVPDH